MQGSNPRHLTITRLGIGSLARWGCVSGALMALLPGLCAGWGLFTALRAVRATVEGWRSIAVPLPLGQSLTLNLIDQLHLASLVASLQSVDALGFTGVLLFTLAAAALLGLFVMLNVVLLGWLFNSATWLAGGIEIETREDRNE